jgi:hypothetical protein
VNRGNATVSCFIVPENQVNVTLHPFKGQGNLCNVPLNWCNGPFPRGSVTLPRFNGLRNQGIVTRHHFKVLGNLCNVTLHDFTGPWN